MKYASFIIVLAVVAPLAAQSPAPLPHLTDYVAKVDDAYAWKLVSTTSESGGTVALLKLTSQKWQGETWDHDVQIFVPKDVKPTATVVLLNTGGNVGASGSAIGLAIADRVKAPVIVLYGIPKQPLYGKREDALIAESFVKYLETKDASWPLLFPMVKSVVKCMDAVQAYAKQEWKNEVSGFIVTGASKRGWTTWLTAAISDKRVKAIAPLVFDSLNLKEQMPHQVKSFGDYSVMIKDYRDRKLLPLPEGDDAKALWGMVDPWAYRDAITIPKMIVNGANDPYWATDAVSLYWNDLKGPKALLCVANAGHDLRAMNDPGADKPVKELLPMKAVDSLAAFCRSVIGGKEYPQVEAKAVGEIYQVNFTVQPVQIRIWSATSETRDFRKSKWSAREPVKSRPGETMTSYTVPSANRFTAHFLEAEFATDGLKYHLSAPVCIVEKK